MLDRLRSRLGSSLSSVGSFFARLDLSPTAWTVVGLVVSLLAAWAYSSGGYSGELLGGVLILVSGWFDIVDGAVARVTGRTSARGAFLDSTLDRVAEVALFTGILLGGYASPVYVLVALSFSLLVSYTRAKGDALGVKLAGVGIGERSERLLILALSSLVGLLGWGILLVALVAAFTFVERSYTAVRALGRSQKPKDISTEPQPASL
ncbi:MAG: CDP-alcohol phosphatidyltransferase family protein [Nitrososphaerota archaeon]|nr:CDP-alcohol phosphatidyltransferase family protein [Nitrososphaerota archaeon]